VWLDTKRGLTVLGSVNAQPILRIETLKAKMWCIPSCLGRPVTSLGHQGRQRGPNSLNYAQASSFKVCPTYSSRGTKFFPAGLLPSSPTSYGPICKYNNVEPSQWLQDIYWYWIFFLCFRIDFRPWFVTSSFIGSFTLWFLFYSTE